MTDSNIYDEKFIEVMTRRVGKTDFLNFEVYAIGQTLLNTINSVVVLGWSSPGSSLDYTHDNGTVGNDLVRDFIAWTSGRKALAPGCEDKLRQHIIDSGWQAYIQDGMSALLDTALGKAS